MRLYLAGPMRGYPDFNFPAFKEAALDLRAKGHEVFSPAESDVNDGFDPKTGAGFLSMQEYMVRDLPEVCRADAVVVLPGWEDSEGAMIETRVARMLHKAVLTYPDMEVVYPREMLQEPMTERPETILQEAHRLIYGDRDDQYGPPCADFKRTADMWSALFQFKLKDGERFRLQDVALAMILLKCSRAMHQDKRDTYTDIAGYAGCGWRCVEGGS